MLALSTVSPMVVATAKTSSKRGSCKVGRAVVTRAAPGDAAGGLSSVVPTSRRAFAAATLAAAIAATTPNPAVAFGNGIPGYDLNEKARDAQRKAIKDELGEQRELARIEKDRRRALREADEAAAAAELELEAAK